MDAYWSHIGRLIAHSWPTYYTPLAGLLHATWIHEPAHSDDGHASADFFHASANLLHASTDLCHSVAWLLHTLADSLHAGARRGSGGGQTGSGVGRLSIRVGIKVSWTLSIYKQTPAQLTDQDELGRG